MTGSWSLASVLHQPRPPHGWSLGTAYPPKMGVLGCKGALCPLPHLQGLEQKTLANA